ncbi:MauE/DoxX family redox-associated membrane protein [Pedobacter sp.]
MDKKRERGLQWIAAAFVLLFSYAAFSKLMDYGAARRAMLLQVFPHEVALVMAWLVPVTELLVAGLLLSVRTRWLGLFLATLLMSSFSAYMLAANLGILGKVPCGCGGILGRMDYRIHLLFNLFFVSLGLRGLLISGKGTLIHRGIHLGKGGLENRT